MKKRISFRLVLLIILLLALIAFGVYAYIKGVRQSENEAQLVVHLARLYFELV